jgi:hypothetical protein
MLLVMTLCVLFVLMPFLFWHATWFGRKLTNVETGRYLLDSEHPHNIQHALSQISDRIVQGDSTVREWYPQVVALAQHPATEIRTLAAWTMGQDNNAGMFHRALLDLLHDPEPMVRRNAALSLVRFRDSSGRGELVKMLQTSPDSGQAWEALRGLYLVGLPDDLPAVERLVEDAPDRIREQAVLTAQAIRIRSERSSSR